MSSGAGAKRALLLVVIAITACDKTVSPDTSASRANRSVSGPSEVVFGPERFTRGKGAPDRAVRTISTAGFEAPFTLEITNGDASGGHRVSSASVELDGAVLLASSAFNQNARGWVIPVNAGSSSQLVVSLAGAPGGYLDVTLTGVRSSVVFCPDGHPGTVADLQHAIDLTPAGGTLLVCDGEHAVKARVNKPMTIRSEHPGGAILADADLAASGQQADPILDVSGYASGTVKFRDITFRVADHGIEPTEPFDKVDIDSVHFIGVTNPVPGATVVAVRVEGTSVPGARVDISHSTFDGLGLGVWPVSNVETNVSWSTFDHFTGGGVTYSNGNTAATHSFGRAEHNHFTNCGTGGCIRLVSNGAIVIANNTIDVGTQAINLGAITFQSTLTGPNTGVKIIEDNVISSSPASGAPAVSTSWLMQSGINLQDPNGVAHIVRRNRISNAFVGILAAADVQAQDNVITNGGTGVQQLGAHSIRFQRNDVSGFVTSFTAPAAAGQYQCNWWGSATGPVGVAPGVPASAYTPFSSTPIAGTAVSCDPGNAIVRVCPSGGINTQPTLADAIAAVLPGGMITLCDGVHAAPDVAINKAVTITSEGPGIATLDGGAADQAIAITNVPIGGVVLLSRIRFVGGTERNVLAGQNGRVILIANSELHPPLTAPYGGPLGQHAGVEASSFGQSVTFTGNTFIGGDIGFLSPSTASSIGTFQGNVFTGQANAAVFVDNAGIGQHVITANEFDGCGPNWCVFTRHPVTLSNNTFTVDMARPTASAVRIENETTANSAIQSNVFNGSGTPGTDRNLPASYAFTGAAIQVRGAMSAFRFNRIANAYIGIVTGGSGSVTGTDNTFEHTYAPVSGDVAGAGPLQLQRNDLLDYVAAFRNPAAFASLNLKCNYWGSAAGPVGVPSGFETSVQPFSTVPIARQGSVACTP